MPHSPPLTEPPSSLPRAPAQVREWRARKDAGKPVGKMCTDRKPFLAMGPATRTFKDECRKIKTSSLCDILKVRSRGSSRLLAMPACAADMPHADGPAHRPFRWTRTR